jgi:hypothetical protein
MAVVIGRAIKHQGLTKDAAAGRVGISPSELANILSGKFGGYSAPHRDGEHADGDCASRMERVRRCVVLSTYPQRGIPGLPKVHGRAARKI